MARPKAPPPAPAQICEQVRQIYAELEQRPIERNCTRLTECCQFKLTGRTPYLTRAEALLAASALRAAGRTAVPASPDGRCPLLDRATGKCQIYAARPFGCRTHFCQAAGGPYARREVADLIHRLEDLSLAVGAREAQPLPTALPAALTIWAQTPRRARARS